MEKVKLYVHYTQDGSISLISSQSNTDLATFILVNSSSYGPSPPPYCNIHVCVRQDQFIGCKKSLNCILTIPSNNVSRVARSYTEPSEELLKQCEKQNSVPDPSVPSCSDKMWDIFYTSGYPEGAVSLQISLQGNDEVFQCYCNQVFNSFITD